MPIAVAFHTLSSVIWVSGMFFAVYVLRLAAAEMSGPDRLALWGRVFGKFFPRVWTAILLLLATGYWMIVFKLGGFAQGGNGLCFNCQLILRDLQAMPTNETDSEALVSTDWLDKNMHHEKVRVVDATWYLPTQGKEGREEYNNDHIPGAVFWDIDFIADQLDPLPHMLPDEATFAGRMEGLGIGDDTFVVVYDAHGLMTAARAWWMLRAMGHDDVAVLNGGLPKWRAEDKPVNAVPPVHRDTSFTAKLRPELVCNREQVQANIESGAAQTVDARSAERYSGAEPEPREGMRSGHIPKSLNLPFNHLLNSGDRTVQDVDALRKLVIDSGIDPAGPVIASCGSGVTACVVALGLHLLGNKNVSVYDGSWSEWGQPGDLPIET